MQTGNGESRVEIEERVACATPPPPSRAKTLALIAAGCACGFLSFWVWATLTAAAPGHTHRDPHALRDDCPGCEKTLHDWVGRTFLRPPAPTSTVAPETSQ